MRVLRLRRGKRHVALLASITVIAGVVLVAPGFGVPGSDFESTDGNLVVDSTKDWESFAGQVAIGQDKPSGATDDSLGQGSKDDSTTPTVTTGAIPNNKSDLDRFYVATENVGAFPGKDFLYLAFTRNNTLGTANISFELNKLTQPAPPAAGGPWALQRSAGDLLVLFDFESGGRVEKVQLRVSKWVISGNAKTVCQASNTVPCWGKTATLGSTVADGAVNKVTVTDPLNGGKMLPQLTFGEAAINLTDSGLLTDLCVGFGSATVRSRSSSAFNSELKDFIAPIKVSIFRSPDPTGANARGSATGAKVDDPTVLGSSNPVVLPNPPGTDPSVSTSQTGPGSKEAGASQLSAKVPAPPDPNAGSDLSADAIRVTSTSSVGAATGAVQTSTAEAVNVNVRNGLVRAELVRGVATTRADSRSSGFGSAGSTFKGLVVNGQAQNNVAPNTRIALPPALHGEGSYVALYELGPDATLKTGTTSQPPFGQAGTYAADLRVTMIRVHITDDNGNVLPGGNPVEIIVSDAVAHSEFQGIRCTEREVSGHAFIASEATTPPLAPAVVGYVAIPRSGGEERQQLDGVTLGGGSVLTGESADSRSFGTLEAGTPENPASEAKSHAQVQNVCALRDAVGNCTVRATVLKAASHSRASGSSRSSDPADTTVVAAVQGSPLLPQGPNTTQQLDGLGFVTFNEQTCDGGGSLAAGCAVGSSTGLTVRGIHIVVTVPENPLGLRPGSEIIVAEAHSDATFVR